ncbi:hypothetical protein RSUY_08820 [Ralstonia solanacearum]|nr:hypothetical protein RSUY_08820 [Ralstonia solanacearum]
MCCWRRWWRRWRWFDFLWGGWAWVVCWWSIPRFVPWRGRLTFFVLPKKVSKERRARDGDPLLEFVLQGGERGKLASLRQAPLFFPPCNTNSRRHLGQERPNRRGAPASTKAGFGGWAGYSIVCFTLSLRAGTAKPTESAGERQGWPWWLGCGYSIIALPYAALVGGSGMAHQGPNTQTALNARRAASNVASSTASSCVDDTNPASKADGAR